MARDRVDHEPGAEKIGLLDVIEERVVVPCRVLEPVVAAFGRNDRFDVLSKHLLRRRMPQAYVILPKIELRHRDPGRITDQRLGEIHDRIGQRRTR